MVSALDAALLASAMRWLMAALTLAGLVWLVHGILRNRRARSAAPKDET